MIEARNLTKRFGDIVAVDHIDATIKDGSVFGLIGTNGAGKSTFLRMLSGVLRPDEGSVTIDGKEVYEDIQVKSRFFYISDDQYFFSNSTPEEMMNFYRAVYPKFNKERFIHLMESFGLDRRRKINTFSKGMKKQAAVIGLSVLRRDLRRAGSGDAADREEHFYGRYAGAEHDADHCVPQPAGAGGYLRPCGSAA